MRERHPSPIQRFKKKMARVVLDDRSSVYTDNGKRQVKLIFKHFDPKYHDVIADDYPLFIEDYLLDPDCYAHWCELTSHLETEELRLGYWFQTPTIASYLNQFHGLKTQS